MRITSNMWALFWAALVCLMVNPVWGQDLPVRSGEEPPSEVESASIEGASAPTATEPNNEPRLEGCEQCIVVLGWESPSEPLLDEGELSPGAGFHMMISFGYRWLQGQLEEVLIEGGVGANARIGAAWRRWVVAMDLNVHGMGSRIPGMLSEGLSLGLSVVHRMPIAYAWDLLLGVGLHHHWISLCQGRTPEGCAQTDLFMKGPGIHFEVGMAWVVTSITSADHRFYYSFFSTLRFDMVWLENEPADRTIGAPAVMWLTGIEVDLDVF